MSTTEYRQCAHPGCACTVAEGQQYCSTYCQQQGKSRQQQAQGAQASQGSGQASQGGAHDCGCGHPACQHS